MFRKNIPHKSWMIGVVVLVILGLALFVSVIRPGLAQEPQPGGEEGINEELVSPSIAPASFPIQGKLTDASGRPLNGNYSIQFSLYYGSAGGTALCSDTNTVVVTNGLFNAYIDNCSPQFNGQMLYLGIKVGTDPEMTPRQVIYPVPYALSLRPGAVISNPEASGHGLEVWSKAAGGLSGTALWVRNTSTSDGIALWAHAEGSDATIIASNNGSGALFKGFGNDGGEHEFIVNNDGSLWAKGDVSQSRENDGLVKAAADVNCDSTGSSITRSFNNVGGTITIANGSNEGECQIDFGFKISDRYWITNAVSSGGTRMATCSSVSDSVLYCYRSDMNGNPLGGVIMILVY